MDRPRKALADLLRPRLKDPGFNDPAFLDRFDAILDAGGMRRDAHASSAPPSPAAAPAAALGRALGPITVQVGLEIVSHEAIVREAYRDSVGVWTWGVGVTDASGHSVARYKDNPQPIARCLEVFVWLLRTNYLPAVLEAFYGAALTEAQLAAALSFHYNTGAIRRADWVRQWKSGDAGGAFASIMNWRSPPEIVARRTKERDLFFDGKWSNDGTARVIPVAKPSYQPRFRAAERVDIRADMATALAEGGA